MPVDTTEDDQEVRIPTGDIELPVDVPTVSGTDPRSTLGRRVPLSILRDLVYQRKTAVTSMTGRPTLRCGRRQPGLRPTAAEFKNR